LAGSGYGEWTAVEKQTAIQFVLALKCSTQEPLISRTRDVALRPKYQPNNEKRKVAAGIVVQITIRYYIIIFARDNKGKHDF